MKHTIVFIAGFAFFSICEAQQQEKQAPRQNINQPQKASNLDIFNGTWKGIYAVAKVGGGFNVGRTDVDATRPDENTVTLNCKESPFEFTLKYNPPEKKYFFTLKNSSGPSIENFPLNFSDDTGYIGQDTVKTEASVLIREVTIKRNEKGGYEWSATFNDSKKGKLICSLEINKDTKPAVAQRDKKDSSQVVDSLTQKVTKFYLAFTSINPPRQELTTEPPSNSLSDCRVFPWNRILEGDMIGTSYTFNLNVRTHEAALGKFDAQIILVNKKKNYTRTTLASATFTTTSAKYEIKTATVTGLDPEAEQGDELILRIERLEGGYCIGTDSEGSSFIEVPATPVKETPANKPAIAAKVDSVSKQPPIKLVPKSKLKLSLNGEWEGVTSQGKPISFTVSKQGIFYVSADFSFNFGSCSISGPTFKRNYQDPIAPIFKNEFSAQVSSRITVTGMFSSDTSASGTILGEAGEVGCQGKDTTTWAATKKKR